MVVFSLIRRTQRTSSRCRAALAKELLTATEIICDTGVVCSLSAILDDFSNVTFSLMPKEVLLEPSSPSPNTIAPMNLSSSHTPVLTSLPTGIFLE